MIGGPGGSRTAAGPDDSEIDRLARAIAQRWSEQLKVPGLPFSHRPANLAEAYRIQDRALALSGRDCAGWKLAMTDPASHARYCIDEPLSGYLLADGMMASPACVKAAEFPGGRAIMECEVGLRIGEMPDGEPGTGKKLGAITAFVAIELPALRFADMSAIDGAMFAADNSAAFRAVLGVEVPLAELGDLADAEVRVEVNGALLAASRVIDPPLTTLEWLKNHLDRRGANLRLRDVVLTGALTGIHPLSKGDHVRATIAGLGVVELDVV